MSLAALHHFSSFCLEIWQQHTAGHVLHGYRGLPSPPSEFITAHRSQLVSDHRRCSVDPRSIRFNCSHRPPLRADHPSRIALRITILSVGSVRSSVTGPTADFDAAFHNPPTNAITLITLNLNLIKCRPLTARKPPQSESKLCSPLSRSISELLTRDQAQSLALDAYMREEYRHMGVQQKTDPLATKNHPGRVWPLASPTKLNAFQVSNSHESYMV